MTPRVFIREWRIGWHQGAVNRHESAAVRHIAALNRLGAKPHRPEECMACRG